MVSYKDPLNETSESSFYVKELENMKKTISFKKNEQILYEIKMTFINSSYMNARLYVLVDLTKEICVMLDNGDKIDRKIATEKIT